LTPALGRGDMTSIDLIFWMALVVLAGIYGIYWVEARRVSKIQGSRS